MATDSSTGGYLTPVGAQPLDDAALDLVLQGYVVGVTGMQGAMVRPRWQPTVPKQPPADTNWCAIGVQDTDREAVASIQHNPAGDGSDTLRRNEVLTILASFYGPGAKGLATLFADGIQIAQNQEAIAAQGLQFMDSEQILTAPELVNEQWIRRYDLSFRLRRQVVRTYAVLNVESAQVTVKEENQTFGITVSN
ncbi:phage neck terminator protein [Herbaspirillum huttiense]|uniref:phage neck terminator protein n=1 Tax=Herbaspirillum huttiense TaxID=863372 RepID=UPI0031D2EEE0